MFADVFVFLAVCIYSPCSVFADGSALISVWLLVALTSERVIAIWFPFKLKEWCTPKRVNNSVLSIILH